MKTRLYVVTAVIGETTKKYLVDAAQKGGAERHVASKHIAAEVADGKTVAALMKEGVTMESAIAEPAAAATQPLPGV